MLEELPSLEKGGFSNIFEINQVPSIVICIDVLLDNNPKFEEIIDQIKNKFIRDREDSLVKEYIENLRNFYEIEKYSFSFLLILFFQEIFYLIKKVSLIPPGRAKWLERTL